MPAFFHFDRSQRLVAGQRIALDRNCLSTVPHLVELFPDGLSQHGVSWLLQQPAIGNDTSAIEMLFEFVRRSFFPETPSRFQSVFACETAEAARNFAARYSVGPLPGRVWEVEAADGVWANMGLLSLGSTGVFSSLNATPTGGVSRAPSQPPGSGFLSLRSR